MGVEAWELSECRGMENLVQGCGQQVKTDTKESLWRTLRSLKMTRRSKQRKHHAAGSNIPTPCRRLALLRTHCMLLRKLYLCGGMQQQGPCFVLPMLGQWDLALPVVAHPPGNMLQQLQWHLWQFWGQLAVFEWHAWVFDCMT